MRSTRWRALDGGGALERSSPAASNAGKASAASAAIGQIDGDQRLERVRPAADA